MIPRDNYRAYRKEYSYVSNHLRISPARAGGQFWQGTLPIMHAAEHSLQDELHDS